MLYREPKVLKDNASDTVTGQIKQVSVLYREPKVLKESRVIRVKIRAEVSVLYREPKVLKATACNPSRCNQYRFQCSTVSRKY